MRWPGGWVDPRRLARLSGNSINYLLRMQRPGMAYMARPDGAMVHSNINFGDRPVKFLYFVNRGPKAVKP